MASQTLTASTLSDAPDTGIQDVAAKRASQPFSKPFLRRLMDFIVETQTHRAQRAIAMHIRSRGLEFTPLDAQQPPH
jgi:hypothetical protein